jgi:maleate isomerase
VGNPLSDVCRGLLTTTNAHRVTVRIDRPDLGLHVDRVAAEALREGTLSLADDSSIDQRQLDTVQWLERNRTTLVQSDFRAAPFPPTALIEGYGVRAQMLDPIVLHQNMIGWVSVHQRTERMWHDLDVQALRSATIVISELLDFER